MGNRSGERRLKPGSRVRCVDADTCGGLLEEGREYTVERTTAVGTLLLEGVPEDWDRARFVQVYAKRKPQFVTPAEVGEMLRASAAQTEASAETCRVPDPALFRARMKRFVRMVTDETQRGLMRAIQVKDIPAAVQAVQDASEARLTEIMDVFVTTVLEDIRAGRDLEAGKRADDAWADKQLAAALEKLAADSHMANNVKGGKRGGSSNGTGGAGHGSALN